MTLLLAHINQRFAEVFGAPDNAPGRENHWALKPDGLSRAAINVLVDGSREVASVWVFDPHVQDDGVITKAIKTEADLHDIIKQIQDRVQRAGQTAPTRGL